MANLLQSGVASAERVFELLDAARAGARPGRRPRCRDERRGRVAFEHVSFRYKAGPAADRGPVAGRGARPDRRDRRPDRRGQDHAGQPAHAVLRARRRPRSRLDGVDIATMPARDAALARSAWCCRTPGCSAARSATTSPTATRRRPRRRSSRRREATYVDRFVRSAARRLRHRDRRGGLERQRGREAADHDRARVPRRPVAPDPRRGDQLGRHPHRGAGAARDGGAARATAPAS